MEILHVCGPAKCQSCNDYSLENCSNCLESGALIESDPTDKPLDDDTDKLGGTA